MDQHASRITGAARQEASVESGPPTTEAERPREVPLLTTGEMARLSNSTLRTVRFYEEEGILRPARRTEGGHRLFERSELDRLMLVTDMRMAGLSLDDIKAILEVKKAASTGADAPSDAAATDAPAGDDAAADAKPKRRTRKSAEALPSES